MMFSVKDSNAQPCNCTKALDDVRTYTKKNYAGFADKIKMLGKAAFEKHDQQARENARKIKDALHCANLLDNWLLFFKDNHLYMHYEPDIAWFKNAVVENIPVSSIDTAALLKKKKFGTGRNLFKAGWFAGSCSGCPEKYRKGLCRLYHSQ